METTDNMSDSLVPGISNRRARQRWFRKFFEGNKSLEGEEHSGWPLEVDNQLRAVVEAGPLTATQEVAQHLNINHSVVVRHLKQTGKVKKPHEPIENIKHCQYCKVITLQLIKINEKKLSFEVSFSLILHNHEPFLNRTAMCDEKWIVYGNQQ